jgi:DNA-binding IclR family transcriptional regulator
VLDEAEVLYVDQVRSYRRGQAGSEENLHAGSRLPVYCTAMGKLLLAYLPEDEQRAVITRMKLTKRAPNTITSKGVLREELAEIKEAGFAVSDRELAPGRYAVAVPVRNDARDVVAAVSLAADSSVISLEELIDALGPHLLAAAERISARLGYRRATRLSDERRRKAV